MRGRQMLRPHLVLYSKSAALDTGLGLLHQLMDLLHSQRVAPECKERERQLR